MAKFAKSGREMTAALAQDLRTYAVKRWPTMNHEWRKAKLASMLGMKVRRVRSYWDAEENMSPRLSEVEAIQALIGKHQEEADAALADRIAELEAQVAFLTAAINRDQMASTGAASHQAGNGGTGQGQNVPRRRSTD
jgi:hypothetical protein